jgi:hypothetical protein
MARRRIGQERLSVGAGTPPRDTTLDEISALIDWTEIDRHLFYKTGRAMPSRLHGGRGYLDGVTA